MVELHKIVLQHFSDDKTARECVQIFVGIGYLKNHVTCCKLYPPYKAEEAKLPKKKHNNTTVVRPHNT